MTRKDRIDTAGAFTLVLFSVLLGFNQVVIRVVNEGLQPIFFAGLRSLGAAVLLALWFGLRRRGLGIERRFVLPGLLIGGIFSVEFVALFLALDLTTVSRVSVIFYTMPLWLALMGHVLIPGERITALKAAGQALAFGGVVIAILWRGSGPDAEASMAGDLLALVGAISWAGIALVARTGLRDLAPDRQLLWQLTVSAVILLALSPLFGPPLRDLMPIHLWGLAFQIVAVAFGGFLLWLWLLSIYPAASVAAFSFLTPIFGVAFGWLLLDERVGLPLLLALALVTSGLVLINKPAQVPQNVRGTISSSEGGRARSAKSSGNS